MDWLGNATQSTYCSIRVVGEEIIYLVMYNVEGYGENEDVVYYSEYLEANYSIVFLHQVPWLPKTNMLDLGAWMTMQSKVENITSATSNNTIPSPGPSIIHGATWRHRNSPIYGISYLRY